jgi:UDP-glucose 4-epimerase
MKVLVTGGAGYIGSHAVKRLREAGHDVVVVDNLFRGHAQAVADDVPFEQISLSLLMAMDRVGVRRMVFSSTCATYGEPTQMPITEDTPQNPINPYGWSKLFTERMLRDYAAARPSFSFAALRYFNVAGLHEDGTLGEEHHPETHIIPVILHAAMGIRDKVTIFGTDYPTPDGTCIRDYIHVVDLVDAHIAVMHKLEPGDQRFYNLGIGRGYSVREIIDAAKRVTRRDFEVALGSRRPGDPPQLYANADKIRRELGWTPRYTDIDRVIDTAWQWFKEHPRGY